MLFLSRRNRLFDYIIFLYKICIEKEHIKETKNWPEPLSVKTFKLFLDLPVSINVLFRASIK